MFFLFPPTKGEGKGRGDIGFCADSVCVGVCVGMTGSCNHDISGTNQLNFTKLAQICHWDMLIRPG